MLPDGRLSVRWEESESDPIESRLESCTANSDFA
jgi:hypothetical protein